MPQYYSVYLLCYITVSTFELHGAKTDKLMTDIVLCTISRSMSVYDKPVSAPDNLVIVDNLDHDLDLID